MLVGHGSKIKLATGGGGPAFSRIDKSFELRMAEITEGKPMSNL